jgi:tetratricopeptide (TPR) repeat protein
VKPRFAPADGPGPPASFFGAGGAGRRSRTGRAPRSSVRSAAQGETRRVALVCLLLVVVTAAVYAQVRGHAFIDLDDDLYVTANPSVGAGLTTSSAAWALTTFHAANWHPLTWLSHMADVQMFGMQPAGAHMTSVLLHIVNTLLAFFVLRSMTGALGRSAMVAALFAVHPMHVESVAWVAERKDVLSTAFWFLTMLAYVRYARGGGATWAALTALFLALGLMAKPMLVTLPLVLLLLDRWPLGRWGGTPPGRRGLASSAWPLVREKIPLFALCAASAVVTFIAQRAGGAVQEIQNVPLSYRLSNAVIACARYLLALFWPHGMAVYYPYPSLGYPLWQAALALAVLAGISTLVWRLGAKLPYLITGWLWYLVTLVPVIGLVQVGGQSMADRYTYIPYLGLFLMILWGAGDALESRRTPARLVAALAVAPLVLLGILAYRQAGLWRDSVTLFTHALSVTRDNAVIEYNLGVTLGREGRSDEAAVRFENAARIWPEFTQAQINLGVAQAAQGKLDEAALAYTRALAVRPDSAQAELNLGGVLAQQGRLDEALPHLERAAALDPADAKPHTNLGLIHLRRGRTREALDHLEQAARLDPRSPEAENNLGLALLVGGRAREAAPHFERAIALDPAYATARENLRRAREASGSPAP